MEIIIIEDEVKMAKSLASLISKLRPAVRITAQLQSIESAVGYFSQHKEPDLIFMDIQLSDGLCFEIFKTVNFRCPIVFCTAFGEYAMDAIKANGIDYLLKPFSKEDVHEAFEKVENFKNFFQQPTRPGLGGLSRMIGLDEGKKSFLVFKDNKYTTIQTALIAFIYIRYESSTIMTFQGQEYPIAQSLDQLQGVLSPQQFYRLNRQYLINFSAVKEVEHYFARKLLVKLVIPCADKLVIGKETASAFLDWLDNR